MPETKDRLLKCFEIVFPQLERAEIPDASQANVPAWDSIAAITLVNVIEDEFAFTIDLEALPELDSFERILAYIKTLNLAPSGSN
jgi:acyl carrier protein